MERIRAAAIRDDDNNVWSLARPARHGDIIHEMVKNGRSVKKSVQGFITEDGTFVNRFEAFRIAEKAGQLLPYASTKPGPLFSEDVW